VNIAFLLGDELLTRAFKELGPDQDDGLIFFDNPNSFQSAFNNQEYGAVVLSDRFFDYSTLCEFIDWIRENQEGIRVTLLLSNKHHMKTNEMFIKYCLSNHIDFVHPGQTVSLIVNKVNKQLYGVETKDGLQSKNVILFMGSTPNIGTTVVTFCTAAQIAKQTEQKIAYLCLNLKSSKIHRYMGMNQPGVSLDGIRAEIKSQGLSRERLQQYCTGLKDIPNLHVLFGNMVREQSEFYSVEDIQYLLNTASGAFDLCLVEVNAYWDNAATICGVLHANTKVVVTTNQLGHFQEDMNRWMKHVSNAFDVEYGSFDLFITQMDPKASAQGFSVKDVRKETGLNVLGTLRKSNRIDELLNEGRIADLALYEASIAEDLKGLINMLISLYKLDRINPKLNKKWLYRLKLLKNQ
jgi:hypothetical protein